MQACKPASCRLACSPASLPASLQTCQEMHAWPAGHEGGNPCRGGHIHAVSMKTHAMARIALPWHRYFNGMASIFPRHGKYRCHPIEISMPWNPNNAGRHANLTHGKQCCRHLHRFSCKCLQHCYIDFHPRNLHRFSCRFHGNGHLPMDISMEIFMENHVTAWKCMPWSEIRTFSCRSMKTICRRQPERGKVAAGGTRRQKRKKHVSAVANLPPADLRRHPIYTKLWHSTKNALWVFFKFLFFFSNFWFFFQFFQFLIFFSNFWFFFKFSNFWFFFNFSNFWWKKNQKFEKLKKNQKFENLKKNQKFEKKNQKFEKLKKKSKIWKKK